MMEQPKTETVSVFNPEDQATYEQLIKDLAAAETWQESSDLNKRIEAFITHIDQAYPARQQNHEAMMNIQAYKNTDDQTWGQTIDTARAASENYAAINAAIETLIQTQLAADTRIGTLLATDAKTETN